MQNPKLSIIVPIYNAAQYLHRCIDSNLSQSFIDYELLLIDDGSTDESGAICDEYAAKDARVRVFHKKNGGVSSARNLGLDNAQGEWIYFVDADDEVMLDGLKTISVGMSNKHDIILGGFEKCNDDGKVIFKYGGDYFSKTITKEESTYAIFDYDFYGYYYLGWMCVWVFRNDLIKKHNLRFSSEIQVKEDTLFITQYICRCVHSCYFTSTPIYRYYETATSIMQSAKKRFEPKYITSFDACIAMYNELHLLYASNHPLILLAKHTIWDRYYIIQGRMKAFDRQDDELLSSLMRKAIMSTGFLYTIQYQIERNKRRIKNYIKRNI